jgi:esterase|tara:strand:+ start:1149 stop:1946 length:798 start_codon:yes stop_codon:yes gene_type:complete
MTLAAPSLANYPLLNFRQQGSGEHLVLIHGLFGSLENLNMVAKVLATDYCVTSVDVRNHGQSFHQNDMAYDNLAQDIVNLLDHLAIGQAYVLGHSMGGKIAMELALSFPQRVKKLIVADIAPVDYPPHHTKIIEGLKAINLKQVKKRSDADKQLAPYVDNLAVRQFLLRNLININNQYSFKCSIEFIDCCYPQIMQGYQGNAQFNKPTLFIKGGDSDYIQASHRTIINKILPVSSVKIIQGSGHWLHAEKTTAFNKIVSDFLTRE